jgi:hypothetical protein
VSTILQAEAGIDSRARFVPKKVYNLL